MDSQEKKYTFTCCFKPHTIHGKNSGATLIFKHFLWFFSTETVQARPRLFCLIKDIFKIYTSSVTNTDAHSNSLLIYIHIDNEIRK